MRQGYQDILANAEQEVEYVIDLVSELSSNHQTRKLWRAWSGILDHYVKAVSAMRRATDQGQSKAWSDSILYQQRNDPVLQYAMQARNSTNHRLEERRDAEPRSVSIEGFIAVSGNSEITFTDNIVVGPDGVPRKLQNGVLKTEDGRYAGGTLPRSAVQEREHFLILRDVKMLNGGVCYLPNPKTPREQQAIEISQHVANWLTEMLETVKDMARKEENR